MKKLVLWPCISIFLVSVFSSCTINKRVYRDGYQVEWNHAKNNVKQNDLVKEEAKGLENNSPQEVKPEITEQEAPLIAQNQPEAPEVKTAEVPKKKKGLISRIIKEDTPQEEMRINSGSKAAAFKSGFKQGLKLMMPDQEAHTLHLAIASFVLGIISLFAYYGAFVLGLLAIIFGAIAIHKIRKGEGTYKGNTLAWIGLICGIIAIALTVIIIKVY